MKEELVLENFLHYKAIGSLDTSEIDEKSFIFPYLISRSDL